MIKLTSIRKIKPAVLLIAAILGLSACLVHESKAEDVSIEATLSEDTTEVGHPVELDLEIKGTVSAQIPESISADGLSIIHRHTGMHQQWINGVFSGGLSLAYEVVPDHAGKFTIPAITIDANGQKLTTKPMTLTVTAGSAGSSNTNGGATAGPNTESSDNNIAYSEFVVPKQSAYVGEAVSVELRVYFDKRARFGQMAMPDIKSEGFTIQKLNQPQQEEVEKNGKHYLLVTFKTAVTPVKSGKLSLGPSEMQFIAQVPLRHDPAGGRPGGGSRRFFQRRFIR